MNYGKLEQNIRDVITEQQLKLGYEKGAVGLYYTADSLKNILQCREASTEELNRGLREFKAMVSPRLGDLVIERKGDRYCIQIPMEGAAFVYEHRGDTRFLEAFLKVIQKHDCTIADIVAVFRAFSPYVVCEKMEGDEFDNLVYFEKEEIDAYRYCIKNEGCHMTYHRFTKEDYTSLFSSN